MEFKDLKKQYLNNKDRIDEAIKKVIDKTDFINGQEVVDLEQRLAQYVGVKYCITCANGTDALSMVLANWKIGIGDAVFVPDFTFFATAEAVSYVGATPVFVDVNEETFNMDPLDLERKISFIENKNELKPKVVIPVDLFGLLADYNSIEKIAKKHNLLVLEDGAQGFGAEFNGRKACSFGNAAITSFFPAKPLGCYGDGGAIFTNDNELASLIKSYKFHGKGENKYDNVMIGVNSRLDTLQAAILNVKLSMLIDYELDATNEIYKKYCERIRKFVKVPFIPNGYKSSFAQYTIKLKSREERDSLKKYLDENNIPSMIYYPKSMHQQKVYSELNIKDKDYPVSSKLCNISLSIPMHPYISDLDIKKVEETIKKFMHYNKFIEI